MQQETNPIAKLHADSLSLPANVPPRHHARLPLGLALAMVLHLFGASVLLWAAQFEPLTEPPRLITLLLHGNGGSRGNGGSGSGEDGAGNGAGNGADTAQPDPNNVVNAPRVTPGIAAKATATTTADHIAPYPAPALSAKVPSPKPAPSAKVPPKRQVSSKTGVASPTTVTATNAVPAAAVSGNGKASTMSTGNGNGSDADNRGSAGTGTGIGNGEGGAPSLAQFTKPAYPRRSRRAGEEGAVLLEALVSPQGELLDVRVVQSSGYPRLDEAARVSLHKARFAPAMRQGCPVAGRLMVPFAFSLKDDA